jgi:hypothetical protein
MNISKIYRAMVGSQWIIQVKIEYLYSLFHLLCSIHCLVYSFLAVFSLLYEFYKNYLVTKSFILVIIQLSHPCVVCYCLFVPSGKKAPPYTSGQTIYQLNFSTLFSPPFFSLLPSLLTSFNLFPQCSLLHIFLLLLLDINML